jgi:predicted N-acyltransferase
MNLESEITANDYVIRVFDDPRQIDAEAWHALLEIQAEPTPFMQHAYLSAMHESGSAVPRTGWSPRFIGLFDRDDDRRLAGAVALYLKTHSYGEYVFDWAWADAYRRHGLRYYPKALGAAPFTPVQGSRLLARDDAVRVALVREIRAFALEAQLSSAHVLFIDDVDRAAFEAEGWLLREGVQFHWVRDDAAQVPDFAAYLATLQRHKRKNIAQERRRVAEAGVTFTTLIGDQIDQDAWDFFHRCYTLTYEAHGGAPYLTRSFFTEMARTMASNWVMFVAARGGERIATSLVAIDPQRRAAWGRYWGCTEQVPCLHFEACYYQPLAWCIAQGYVRFEGGAQGAHKMARGLMPARTSSAHWLADERFAGAVADFLSSEREGVEAYVDELREHSPFKASDASPSSSTFPR